MAKIGRSRSATAAAFACIFVFMLLLLATPQAAAAGVGSVVEEKRTCESQSHRFKGKCLSDHNCGAVCNTEGFPRGNCRGFRQRCFCVRPC